MARTYQHVMEDILRQEERKTGGRNTTDVMPCQSTAVPTHKMVLEGVWCAELLNLLGEFLCRRCTLLKDLSPDGPATMLRTVDMFMVVARLQETPFLCPGSVVFLYMVCRDSVPAELASMEELCAVLLTCCYVSFSYIGHRICYMETPFIVEADRQAFWKRTFDITKRMSHKMLQINISSQFFAQVLADMKNRTDH